MASRLQKSVVQCKNESEIRTSILFGDKIAFFIRYFKV